LIEDFLSYVGRAFGIAHAGKTLHGISTIACRVAAFVETGNAMPSVCGAFFENKKCYDIVLNCRPMRKKCRRKNFAKQYIKSKISEVAEIHEAFRVPLRMVPRDPRMKMNE